MIPNTKRLICILACAVAGTYSCDHGKISVFNNHSVSDETGNNQDGGSEGECATVADCESLLLPDNCIQGSWQCIEHRCQASCDKLDTDCPSEIPPPAGQGCHCEWVDCKTRQMRCICDLDCYGGDCLINADEDGNASTNDPFLKNCDVECAKEDDLSTNMECNVTNCEIPEICNGKDDNGDGNTDEGFPDADGDNIADCVEKPEVCNGKDDDGNGKIDEGFPDGDGDGIADCVDVAKPEVDTCGVQNDQDGNLVLQPETNDSIPTHHYIWIANSPEGTVSKLDTVTGEELGRYRTGPEGMYPPDPSRTTVGLHGDVVVANRAGSAALLIVADPSSCPDKNGNGTVDTSVGSKDVLPWGQDECILWYHKFPDGSLARAAAFDYRQSRCGETKSTSVWIGLFSAEKLVQLDAETGDLIAEVEIPGHSPYGMAMDGSGKLWVWGFYNEEIVWLDTETLAWGAVAAPSGCAYGIAVDDQGRVWTSAGNCVARYDPNSNQWSTKQIDLYGGFRGLAVDGSGSVWIAASTDVVRVNQETLELVEAVSPSTYASFIGMAIDFQGKIWAVSQMESAAYRIDPDSGEFQSFPVGRTPYTYSDMTGFQLRNVAPAGYFRVIVLGCDANAQWENLEWSAQTPDQTSVQFQARVANSENELAKTPFVLVAKQPSDLSPSNLKTKLDSKKSGGSKGLFLELDISLKTSKSKTSPTLKNVILHLTGCAQEQISLDLNVTR